MAASSDEPERFQPDLSTGRQPSPEREGPARARERGEELADGSDGLAHSSRALMAELRRRSAAQDDSAS